MAHLRAPKPQPVDLGNPLHLHHLAKWLTRYPNGVLLEEALPAIAGAAAPVRAVESVVETYRPARSAPFRSDPARSTSARSAPAVSEETSDE